MEDRFGLLPCWCTVTSSLCSIIKCEGLPWSARNKYRVRVIVIEQSSFIVPYHKLHGGYSSQHALCVSLIEKIAVVVSLK